MKVDRKKKDRKNQTLPFLFFLPFIFLSAALSRDANWSQTENFLVFSLTLPYPLKKGAAFCASWKRRLTSSQLTFIINASTYFAAAAPKSMWKACSYISHTRSGRETGALCMWSQAQ